MKVIQAREVAGQNLTEQADVIVIGSGAGGAVMGYELAAAGYRVLILEAGPYVPSDQFNEQLPDMMARLYQDGGSQANADGDITVLQGACVGGSTTVNAAAAFRIPDWIAAQWAEHFGLDGFDQATLAPLYERIEQRLAIHANAPHELNANSRLMAAGAAKLGWAAKPIPRNIRDCALTGYCIQGCRYDRKQSMLVTYLPWAVEAGARLYADTRVTRIHTAGDRVTGVSARFTDPTTGEAVGSLEAQARLVVCAAGTVQTPLLLQDSGLANGSGQVGRNLACHPSVNVAALLPQKVNMWQGALLGSYVDQFAHDADGGFLMEGGGGEPAAFCPLVPGFGAEHARRMERMDQVGNIVLLVHDANSGRVYREDGRKVIDYRLGDADRTRVRRAMRAAAELWFAAGAEEVWLPTTTPTALTNPGDLAKIDSLPVGHNDLIYSSYHPQGTCCMGADPAACVVNPQGQAHEIANLVIADASVFPTSVLVNTQLPVYVNATRVAELIKAEPQRYGL